ncbi:hypothetical protein RRF57_012429 [Xylaria bambusicola]|uniref:Uncharacterized protein n=1 Tax=Xylaria bambusicola TaxID=326684 RepID=A0AAN7UV65_9PEZI
MSNNLSELPMEAYNMIYDKLPMEGWWPWPRKENEDDLNHSHEGDCEKDGSGSLQKCTVQHKVRLQENLIDIEAELNMKK